MKEEDIHMTGYPGQESGQTTNPFQPINKELNWGYLTRKNRKVLEEWSLRHLTHGGYTDFKIAWLPLLMGARAEGITNQELSCYFQMAKQAMSKTVKEMEEAGYLRMEKNSRDGRSQVIFLTERGQTLRLHAMRHMMWLDRQLQKLIGPERFLELKQDMSKILHWFDSPEGLQDPY